MSILNAEEIRICETHLQTVSAIISKIQKAKEHALKKRNALSMKKRFLRKYFSFLGEKIIKWFLDDMGLVLEEKINNLSKVEKNFQEKVALYRRSIIFFQNENPATKDAHELLVCLAQLFIDYRITSQIPAELWEIKNNVDERTGTPINDADRKTVEFIRSLNLLYT